MSFWAEWRAQRDRSRRASSYVTEMLRAPESADVSWLVSIGVSETVAQRELTFAKRAIGLIVAERDALDDRTASEVAHKLAPVISREAKGAAGLGREWAARWRAYTAALAVRGNVEAPATRLARVLLAGAGVGDPSNQQVMRATESLLNTRGAANIALRDVFGVAALPDDVRPSAVRG